MIMVNNGWCCILFVFGKKTCDALLPEWAGMVHPTEQRIDGATVPAGTAVERHGDLACLAGVVSTLGRCFFVEEPRLHQWDGKNFGRFWSRLGESLSEVVSATVPLLVARSTLLDVGHRHVRRLVFIEA